MKPWDIKTANGNRPDDSFMLPLWSGFRPHNFYFATIGLEENITIVFIVPKEYFDEHGVMYEDSIPIVQYIPGYLTETSECIYEVEGVNVDSVRRDMIARGFSYGHFFQNFVNRQNVGIH